MNKLAFFSIFVVFTLQARSLDPAQLNKICGAERYFDFVVDVRETYVEPLMDLEIENLEEQSSTISDQNIDRLMSDYGCKEEARAEFTRLRDLAVNDIRDNIIETLQAYVDADKDHLEEETSVLEKNLANYRQITTFAQSNRVRIEVDRELLTKAEQRLEKARKKEMQALKREIRSLARFANPRALIERYNQLADDLGKNHYSTRRANRLMAAGQARQDEIKESCTEVSNFNEAVSLDNTRSQFGGTDCYANVSADLVSHYLNKEVSDMDIENAHRNGLLNRIGQFFGITEGESELGGLIGQAIKRSRDRGFCTAGPLLESPTGYMKGFFFESTDENPYPKGADISFFDDITTSPDWDNDNIDGIDTFRFFEVIFFDEKPQDCGSCAQNTYYYDHIHDFFPSLDLEIFQDILGKSSRYNFHDNLVLELLCTERTWLPESTKVKTDLTLTKRGKERGWNKLDQLLNEGKLVGFGFGAEILKHQHSFDNLEEPHVVSIIGRRFNGNSGECEYLVRNSWGPNCSKFASAYECDRGHTWIAQEKLNRTMMSIVYLEDE